MKIVVAGDWHSQVHEDPLSWAFGELGHAVVPFRWHRYFSGSSGRWTPAGLSRRVQDRLLAGPLVARLNADLRALVAAERPDMLFIYRGTHIHAATLAAIKATHPQVFVAGYNNDDPFSSEQPRWFWRHFLSGLPYHDVVFAYREHNLPELRAAGARRAALLRSWYDPRIHRPASVPKSQAACYESDVTFVGHLEDDGRFEALERLVAEGWKIRVFGPPWEWGTRMGRSRLLRGLPPAKLVWGEEYAKAIGGARAALCFLSKLNRDTYTRRCFEIPAIGRPLFAEWTEDLSRLFDDGQNAVLFTGEEDLVSKLRIHLADPTGLEAIARRGHDHVRERGHDVVSRARAIVETSRGLRTGAR